MFVFFYVFFFYSPLILIYRDKVNLYDAMRELIAPRFAKLSVMSLPDLAVEHTSRRFSNVLYADVQLDFTAPLTQIATSIQEEGYFFLTKPNGNTQMFNDFDIQSVFFKQFLLSNVFCLFVCFFCLACLWNR